MPPPKIIYCTFICGYYVLSVFPVILFPRILYKKLTFLIQVKKVFAQVVIAMGHHGYMELEGGTQMIEFIVTQCSLQAEPPVTFIFLIFMPPSLRG